MMVHLIGTESPSSVVDMLYAAYKQCVSSASTAELYDKAHDKPFKEKTQFILKYANMGHGSPLEHVVFPFAIDDVSRVLTHQLVRHRIASYTQQSLRYTKAKGPLQVVIPDKMQAWLMNYHPTICNELFNIYKDAVNAGIPEEDARYILPLGVTSSIFVTMNLRSLMNFMAERLCSHAQLEIRELAQMMRRVLIQNYGDWIGGLFLPKCGARKCPMNPEGKLCNTGVSYLETCSPD